MELCLAKGIGDLIKKIVEDYDVENENEASMSKVAPLGEGCGTNNYHEDKEEEETALLFVELDQLLKHVAFLNAKLRESMVGVDPLVVVVDAPVVPVDAPAITLEDEIQRPRRGKEI
nr:hypothetical protein [Tanacetum cinerariifolium]